MKTIAEILTTMTERQKTSLLRHAIVSDLHILFDAVNGINISRQDDPSCKISSQEAFYQMAKRNLRSYGAWEDQYQSLYDLAQQGKTSTDALFKLKRRAMR